MKKALFHTALLVTAFSFFPSFSSPAEPSLRGMDTPQDFRLGPILQGGISLYLDEPGDRQYYMLELRGESPDHGFSRIFLRGMSLYRLLDLPQLNVEEPTIERTVRFHHQFYTLGLESPVLFPETSPYNIELGWASRFTLARIQFRNTEKPESTGGIADIFSDFTEIPPTQLGAQQKTNAQQADTQFLGGELGMYSRYYQFYPFVPYASARLMLGNFFDQDAFVNGVEQRRPTTSSTNAQPTPTPSPTFQREFKSGFKAGFVASAGLDVYIFSRGLIGLEYTFWQWDFGVPEDATHTLVFKSGFMF